MHWLLCGLGTETLHLSDSKCYCILFAWRGGNMHWLNIGDSWSAIIKCWLWIHCCAVHRAGAMSTRLLCAFVRCSWHSFLPWCGPVHSILHPFGIWWATNSVPQSYRAGPVYVRIPLIPFYCFLIIHCLQLAITLVTWEECSDHRQSMKRNSIQIDSLHNHSTRCHSNIQILQSSSSKFCKYLCPA